MIAHRPPPPAVRGGNFLRRGTSDPRVRVFAVLTALLLALASTAVAEPQGTSIGATNRGRLVGGAPLPRAGPGFRFESVRGNPDARYGTPMLVGALVRAVSRVERELPGGRLVIEDLSAEHGGPLPGHGSHHSGRDVDIRFYAADPQGRPVDGRNVRFGPDGRALDGGPERLDVPRNWLLVRALLEDEEARVRYVFVHRGIERALLAHARDQRAPASLRVRAARVMRGPGTPLASPHDDHMHVRIECPPSDRAHGCRSR